MSESSDLLRLLRRGPVNQAELTRRFGPYRLSALKRLLAADGHILSTEHTAGGTFLRLAHDGADQQRIEGAA